MKAIILAAGRGMRLRPHHDDPKCLLQLSGESLLFRITRLLRESEVSNITAVVGYKQEMIRELYPDLKFVSNPFYAVTNTLASLILALQDAQSDVLIINGDTVFEPTAIRKLLAVPGNAFAVKETETSSEEVKVRLREGKIVNIGKWLTTGLEAVGLYKLTEQFARDVFEVASSMVAFSIFNNYYEDAFDKVIQGHSVTPVHVEAEEIDTWEDYKKVQETRWD